MHGVDGIMYVSYPWLPHVLCGAITKCVNYVMQLLCVCKCLCVHVFVPVHFKSWTCWWTSSKTHQSSNLPFVSPGWLQRAYSQVTLNPELPTLESFMHSRHQWTHVDLPFQDTHKSSNLCARSSHFFSQNPHCTLCGPPSHVFNMKWVLIEDQAASVKQGWYCQYCEMVGVTPGWLQRAYT